MTAGLTYSQGIRGPVLADLTGEPFGWADFALCREVDPDLFFDSHGGEYTKVKAFCDGCPVKDTCLDFALSVERRLGPESVFGVFGGLTATERIRILNAEQVVAVVPDPGDTKTCTGPCRQVKPLTAFSGDRSAPDGHKQRCKICMAEQQSRQRQAAA